MILHCVTCATINYVKKWTLKSTEQYIQLYDNINSTTVCYKWACPIVLFRAFACMYAFLHLVIIKETSIF